MTNLHSVTTGQNKYCGPAVLSILTGRSTDDCAFVIGQVNGKYNVTGVTTDDLLKAANKLGFDSKAVTAGSSLYGTLVRIVNEDGMYIISLEKHFVTVEVKDKVIYFCDNHTKEPIPASQSARLIQRVERVHKVSKRREPKLLAKSYYAEVDRYSDTRIEVSIIEKLMFDIGEDKKSCKCWLAFSSTQQFNEFVSSFKLKD